MPAPPARPIADLSKRRWADPALLALVTLVGLALRLYGLWRNELSYDESATWWFSGQSLPDMWGEPGRSETNPPLFYTLAHAFRALGGAAEDARLLTAVGGAACIPLTFLLAARLAGRFSGHAAALLVAVSAAQIRMSQDARAYAVLTAAALVALLAVQRLLAVGGAAAFIAYVLAALTALYLHNTAVLLVAACNVIVLLAWPRGDWRGFLWRWIAANAVILVGYLPWITVVIDQSLHALAHFWLQRPTPTDFRYLLMNTFALRFLKFGEPFADLLFLGLLATGVVATRRVPFARALAAAVVVGVPLASFLISQWRPIMNIKTLLWLIPFGLVFVAAGTAAFRRARLPALAVAVGLEALATQQYLGAARVADWSALAARIAAEAHAGEALVVALGFDSFVLNSHGLPDGLLATYALGPPPAGSAPSAVHPLPADHPMAALGRFPRIWAVLPAAGTVGMETVLDDLRKGLACAFAARDLGGAEPNQRLLVFERLPAPTCS